MCVDDGKVLSCVSQDFTFNSYNFVASSGISVVKNEKLIITTGTTFKWKLFLPAFLAAILFIQPILGNTFPSNGSGPFENSSNNRKIKITKQSLELIQNINIQRQEYLQKQCTLLRYENTDFNNLTEFQMEHMIVDQQHRLLYCYVPKVSVAP